MMQNTVDIKIYEDRRAEVIFPNGSSEVFLFQESFKKASILLDRMNDIRDLAGNPIYTKYKFKNYFLWGFHQEELLSVLCRSYISYSGLIEFLKQKNLKVKNIVGNSNSGLPGLLDLFSLNSPKFGVVYFVKQMPFLLNLLRVGRMALWNLSVTLLSIKIRIEKIETGLFSYDTICQGKTYDRRLMGLYESFFERREPFLELFSSFSLRGVRNAWARGRMPLFYPPVSISFDQVEREKNAYNLESFGGSDRLFVRLAIEYTERLISQDKLLVIALTNVISKLGLRKIYSIDDVWSSTPLVIACRELNIPLTAFQHGSIHKYLRGLLQIGIPGEFTLSFPKLNVFSETDKALILELSNAYRSEQINVAGYIRPLELEKQSFYRPDRVINQNRQLNLIYPFEFMADLNIIRQYIEAFQRHGIKVFLKSRWDSDSLEQLKAIGLENIEVINDINDDRVRKMDICAASSTTFLHEMYYLGVPLWILDSEVDLYNHMIDYGLATSVTLAEVQALDFDPYKKMINIFETEKVYSFKNIYKTGQRLEAE